MRNKLFLIFALTFLSLGLTFSEAQGVDGQGALIQSGAVQGEQVQAPLPKNASENEETSAPVAEIDKSVDEAIQNSSQDVKTMRVKDIEVMTPNANKEIKSEVLNDTNNNLKSTINKFLYAMAGVLISSVLIFLILFFMNKLNLYRAKNETMSGIIKEDFNVPTGENDALRVFLDKTK